VTVFSEAPAQKRLGRHRTVYVTTNLRHALTIPSSLHPHLSYPFPQALAFCSDVRRSSSSHGMQHFHIVGLGASARVLISMRSNAAESAGRPPSLRWGNNHRDERVVHLHHGGALTRPSLMILVDGTRTGVDRQLLAAKLPTYMR